MYDNDGSVPTPVTFGIERDVYDNDGSVPTPVTFGIERDVYDNDGNVPADQVKVESPLTIVTAGA